MTRQEKDFCVINHWFSSPRRMGLAAAVSIILAILSVILHNLLSVLFGEKSLVSSVTFTMAFIFISGFAVALAVSLILWLESKLHRG